MQNIKKNNPLVSVVIPVYNAVDFIEESIQSILCQTLEDYEILVICNNSNDGSREKINTISDKRIRVVDNNENVGIPRSRNIGIVEARGKYIAWLDADDISNPKRIEKQVELFERDNELGLCGSYVKAFTESFNTIWKYPVKHEEIKALMFFNNPFATSSVMIRRRILLEFQLFFNDNFIVAEDYDLWERMSHYCKMSNIPEVLACYRIHASQVSSGSTMKSIQEGLVAEIRRRQISRLGIKPNNDELRSHSFLAEQYNLSMDDDSMHGVINWTKELKNININMKIYPTKEFLDLLSVRISRILRNNIASLKCLISVIKCDAILYRHKIPLLANCMYHMLYMKIIKNISCKNT